MPTHVSHFNKCPPLYLQDTLDALKQWGTKSGTKFIRTAVGGYDSRQDISVVHQILPHIVTTQFLEW